MTVILSFGISFNIFIDEENEGSDMDLDEFLCADANTDEDEYEDVEDDVDSEDEVDVVIEYSPPVPLVSISPSSPNEGDEITVTIQWFSVKGGSHPYTLYLDRRKS